MANGGSITWVLDVDDARFQSGLKNAEKSIESVSNSAKSAAKIIAGLGVAGATAFGALAVKGVKLAGNLESAEQGFVALLGSAKKAEDVMARIKKEAAATPFELPGLVEGTQALAAITKNGDKAIDILLDVGKAIATSGKGQAEMNSVIANLQQVASTGVVSEMDIRQFQRAIPLFNDILKESNLTAEGLKNSTNAAELLFGAFEKAGAKGGITAAGFTAQAGTFNQVMSNLSDTIGITLSDFVKASGIFDLFKGAVTRVVTTMSTLGTKFSMIIGLIRSGIQGDLTGKFLRQFGLNEDDAIVAKWFRFGKVLRNVFETIKAIFQGQDLKVELAEAFSFFLGDDMAKAEVFANIVAKIVTAFRTLSDWVIANKEIIFTFLQGMAIGFAALSVVGVIAGLLSALASPLVLIVAAVGVAFVLWKKYADDLMPVITLLGTIFRDLILPQLMKVWDAVQTNLLPALQRLWAVISPLLIPVLKVLAVILGGTVLASIMGLIKALEWSIKIFSGVVNAVSWFVEKVVGFFKWLYNILVGNSIIPDLIMGIVTWFGKLPSLIMSALSGLKNAIVAPFRDALQGALNLAKDMADKIRSTISKAFDIRKRNSPSILDRLNTLKDAVAGTLESIEIPTYSSQISSNLGGGNKLAYSTSTPNFTVNIGTYAGTDMEKRELARQIFEAYDDYAKSRGLNI